jgi:putative Holliday junction resolvase
MRFLALDIGDRRIGVALSDETATLASGLDTIERVGPRKDLEAVAELVRQHQPAEVVVGMPFNMDGSVGPQAEKVKAFMDQVHAKVGVPVQAWDERLTTVEAHEILRKSGVSWGQRKGLLDKVAATVILQEYLDHRKAQARASRPRS